jgi:hypothetical protein
MKIAVIGIDEKKSGGSYHQSLKTYKILSHIKEFEFNFIKNSSGFYHSFVTLLSLLIIRNIYMKMCTRICP